MQSLDTMDQHVIQRSVTILKVFSPNHFLIKELADPNIPSTARLFADLETQYLNNYDLIDIVPTVAHLPIKGSYVLVKPENDCNWYRGRVEAILETAKGPRINVYLLDYGRCELARKEWIREMAPKFHQVPFQAVDFILPNLLPCSMTINEDLTLSRKPSESWDISAVESIKSLVKVKKTVHVIMEHSDSDNLYYGQMIVEHQGSIVNINEYLLKNRYAYDTLIDNWHIRLLDDGIWAWFDPSQSPALGNPLLRSASSLSGRQSRASTYSHASSRISQKTPQRTSLLKPEQKGHSSGDQVSEAVPERPPSMPGLVACSPEDIGMGRGRKLLNLSFEAQNQLRHWIDKKNTPKAKSSNRSRLSSMQRVHSSVSESGSSTLSMSFGSQDGDETEKEDFSLRPPTSHTPSSLQRVPCVPQTSRTICGSVLDASILSCTTSTPKKVTTSLQKSPNSSCSTPKAQTSGQNFQFGMPSSTNVQSHFITPKFSTITTSPGSRSSSLSYTMPQKNQPTASQFSTLASNVQKFRADHFVPCQDVNKSALPQNELPIKSNISQNEDTKTLPNKSTTIPRVPGFTNQDKSFMFLQAARAQEEMNRVVIENTMSTILRFGSHIPKPVHNFGGSSLPEVLIQKLEELYPGVSITQSHAFPAVLRGRSVAVIGPKHSGKTISCILPLLSFLLQSEDYQILDSCTGPLAVILCPSWTGCQTVYDHCTTFIPENYHNKIVCMFGGSGVQNKFSVVGGCDMLITTPGYYLEIQKTVSLDRCCHVMLHNADILTECFTDQIREIMVSYMKKFQSHAKKSVPCQVLLCSSQCTTGVQSFIHKMMPDPIVLISSFMEAAIYARIAVFPKATTKARLSSTLVELLHDGSKRKTVVCTTTGPLAVEVSNFLNSHSVYNFAVHENLEHFNMKVIKSEWEDPSSSAVLIVSDVVLPEMEITSAEWLIHYDIPDTSRLNFGYRFACLAQNIQAKVEWEEEQRRKLNDCLSHVLITPEYEFQSVDLIRLFNRLKVESPPQLLEMGAKKQLTKNLCPNVQLFGNCKLKNWCIYRHLVKNHLDKPQPDLPQWGEVKVLITHVVNGSHFYGRLLQYRDPSTGSVISDQKSYLNLQVQLTMHFGKAANSKPHGTPEVGDICALYKPGDAHHRVQVLLVHELEAVFMLREATVFYLDEGRTEVVKVDDLLTLPHNLASISPQAINIYACGVQPPDGNQAWTSQAGMFVGKSMTHKEVHGKVVLCLKDSLFVESVVVRTQVLGSINMNTFNHSQELIKQGFAVPNPEHVSLLKELCRDEITFQSQTNGVHDGDSPKEDSSSGTVVNQAAVHDDMSPVSSKNSPHKQSPQNITSSQKYHKLNPSSVHTVFVSIIENPELFYIQPVDTYNDLLELNNRINQLVTENQLKRAHNLVPGSLCLSSFGENGNSWFRASVTSVDPDGQYQMFFVDFGDTGKADLSDLFEIPPELLKLPFQAVECSLGNIGPVDTEWSEKATCLFVDLTRDEDDVFKEMQLQVLDSKTSKVNANKDHYLVKLREPQSKSVASQLVEKSLARKLSQKIKSSCTSDNEADCECSPASTPEPDEANFFNALMQKAAGEDTRVVVETSDDESVRMALKRTYRKPCSANFPAVNQNLHFQENPTTNSPSCDMPRLAVVENFTKCLTPKILWYQTQADLILNVKVDSYEEYEFFATSTEINLKILRGDYFYVIREELFDRVISTLSHSVPLGQVIKIKLHKQKKKHWPRLIKKSEKVQHIAIHPDHLETTSQDEAGSYRSNFIPKGAEKYTTLHVDPRNMDDRNYEYTESDSDWARENAHDLLS